MTGRRIASLVIVAVFAALVAHGAVAETWHIRADRLHPVSQPPIEDGAVLVVDGRIAAVGTAASVEAPAGARTLRAAVVTPGLIDAHSTVGLAGLENVPSVLDQDDPFEPDQAAFVRSTDSTRASPCCGICSSTV